MTEAFCHSILRLPINKSKALCNLVMGLASQVNASSPTAISLEDCYHYQYSSISDSINALFEAEQHDPSEVKAARLEMEKKFISQDRLFT